MAENRDRFEWDEHFAANLRSTREAMGITQAELAERMRDRGFGFHQATIYKIEKGERKVSIGEAMAIAGLFDIDVTDLAEAPTEVRDAEFYASLLWERTRNLIEAIHDLWGATDRFKSHQEGLTHLLDTLLKENPETGARLYDSFSGDEYQGTLKAFIESMYGRAAANSTVQAFRDELIRQAQQGDFYEIISNLDGWPLSMPTEPELKSSKYSSWDDRTSDLRRLWRLDENDG